MRGPPMRPPATKRSAYASRTAVPAWLVLVASRSVTAGASEKEIQEPRGCETERHQRPRVAGRVIWLDVKRGLGRIPGGGAEAVELWILT